MAERIEFGIYVPQLAFTYDDVLSRARLCEELGFSSFWLYDHLYGPGMPDLPALEGWTLATALLAQTTKLRVGHLVLCATFRHPALLAKMAATLDVISNGRLELGLGSGSYEPEHTESGIPWGTFAERSEILAETLEIVTQMFASEKVTVDGKHFQPIIVGGIGEKRTLPLVARYADVWNLPTYALDVVDQKRAVLDAECKKIGREPASIRISQEAVLVLAPDDAALAEALPKAERRFGGQGWGLHEGNYIGTPATIVERIKERIDQGITYFVFFSYDRATEATLRLFADEVMPAFA